MPNYSRVIKILIFHFKEPSFHTKLGSCSFSFDLASTLGIQNCLIAMQQEASYWRKDEMNHQRLFHWDIFRGLDVDWDI